MVKKFLKLAAASLLLVLSASTSHLLAQSPGLQISPTRTTINANSGETKQFNLSLKNIDTKNGSFDTTFANFTSSADESGEPKLVTEQIAYGAGSWLSGTKSIPLTAGQSATTPITVTVPKNTLAGTYYAIVRFTPQNTDPGALKASVTSLVFVNVGQITQTIQIEGFEFVNDSFVARVKNTGTGFTVPEIKIELFDDKNTVIETLDANPNSGGIITDTIRKYSVPSITKINPTGQYKARLSVKTESSAVATKDLSLSKIPPGSQTLVISPPAAEADKKKSNVPWLGIAIGTAIVLLLAALTTFLLLRKRRAREIHPVIPAAAAIPQPAPTPIIAPLAPAEPTRASYRPPAPPLKPINRPMPGRDITARRDLF